MNQLQRSPLNKRTNFPFQFLGTSYYALLNFLSRRNSRVAQHQEVDNILEEIANSPQQSGSSATYENLTSDGNPIPGFSRGVVHYRKDYINTRSTRNSWYDKLQLIRPLAMEWLRNTWGNIDQFGRHVYDVMQRAQHSISSYDKLSETTQGDLAGSGNQTSGGSFGTLERSETVRCESLPATEK